MHSNQCLKSKLFSLCGGYSFLNYFSFSIPEYNLFTGDLRAPNPDYFKSTWGRFKKRSKLLKEGQTLYSFRHTGAIDIYKRTGSIEKLKTAMGHSNIMVSLTYLRGLDVTELQEEDMLNL